MVVVPNLATPQTGITFRHSLPLVHCSRRQTGYDFDHVPVFPAFWQYACVIAWATEKSVEILGEFCILPNLWYSSQVFGRIHPCTTRHAGLDVMKIHSNHAFPERECHGYDLRVSGYALFLRLRRRAVRAALW